MQAFPHHYTVAANGSGTGDVTLKADELPTLRSASPIPFDGHPAASAGLRDANLSVFARAPRCWRTRWRS
jgi:hypothetical protein